MFTFLICKLYSTSASFFKKSQFLFTVHIIFKNYYQTTYNEVGCYPDIYIVNGLNRLVDYNGFVDHIFCSNETRFVSTADLITIRYNDRAATYEKQTMSEGEISSKKIYAPFRISYFKVVCYYLHPVIL